VASKAVQDIKNATFAPVLGLALRGKLDQEGLLNLLPAWPKQQLEVTRLNTAFSTWLAVTAITVWLMGVFLGSFWWWINGEQTSLKAEKQSLEIDQAQESEMLSWVTQFNKFVKSTEVIIATQTDYDSVLSNLAALTPRAIKITSFVYRPLVQEWSIAGIAEKREDVLMFDRELKNSEVFSDAQLYFSSLKSGEQVVFRFIGGSSEQ